MIPSSLTAAGKDYAMAEFVTASDSPDSSDPLTAFEVGGEHIAVARIADSLYGFGDTCTHAGCSLAAGRLEDTIVTCPCHGSQFDVTTGDVVRGPAQRPVRSYAVRVENGALQIEI
jgi:nitrite reductase/ring-hydroxylating ferredoxin subunit